MPEDQSVVPIFFKKNKQAGAFFLAIAVVVAATNWYFQKPAQAIFEEKVPRVFFTDFFETRWLYLGLMAFTLSCPLIFGRLPFIRFDREWGRFFRSNWPVSLFFIAWDIIFTKLGVWNFSKNYTVGDTWLFGLPIEEWLFFIIVDAACVFIFFSLKKIFPCEPHFSGEKWVLLLLAMLFFALGFVHFDKLYTSTTAFWCGCALIFTLFLCKEVGGSGFLPPICCPACLFCS